VPELTHGFKIDRDKCNGRLACMRACPTQAIRVREGKARVIPHLCIDCGLCLTACPSGAIRAETRSFAEFDKFKYKVAVPSPVLFGQFPMAIGPGHIVAGLLGMGFDAVWDFTVELALVNRAILNYVERWEGPFPLLSVSCPVVVRLVQVLYPSMVDQLIQVQVPRELAGLEAKRKFSEQLGIPPDDIAAIYITPCQAKTISILKPAEGAKSNLEGALGISDVYNNILALTHTLQEDQMQLASNHSICSGAMLRWTINEAQGQILQRYRYMSVTGLANVIQVFDDIEKGKLRNIEYLECDACWGGCIGGNLTVDNIYVTRSKLHRLISELPAAAPQVHAEVARRYPTTDLSLKGRLRRRTTDDGPADLRERVRRMKAEEAVTRALPGLDCGLCGAPSCDAFARDVARGTGQRSDCVFLREGRLRELKATYLSRRKRPPESGEQLDMSPPPA
jgi:iron only hydrogenase large subunit-like protein